MKMEQTDCSETSAYKIQTLGDYTEESIQHSEHDESLISRINITAIDSIRSITSVYMSILSYYLKFISPEHFCGLR